jgi:hypothetical protein
MADFLGQAVNSEGISMIVVNYNDSYCCSLLLDFLLIQHKNKVFYIKLINRKIKSVTTKKTEIIE